VVKRDVVKRDMGLGRLALNTHHRVTPYHVTHHQVTKYHITLH
jgi:hypothetical protein